MRDPFETGPVLRLGDASPKKTEPARGFEDEGLDRLLDLLAVAYEIPREKLASIAEDVGYRRKGADRPRYSPEDVSISVAGLGDLRASDDDGVAIDCGQPYDFFALRDAGPKNPLLEDEFERYAQALANAYELPSQAFSYRGPVGDGALRYEEPGRLVPSPRAVDPEILSEEEFARKYPGPVEPLVGKISERDRGAAAYAKAFGEALGGPRR